MNYKKLRRLAPLAKVGGVMAMAALAIGVGTGKVEAQTAPNDHFTNRIAITGHFWSISGNSSNATEALQSGEPSGYDGTIRRTLWYSWVAPTNGLVRMDTFGSTFNTILGVFTNGVFSGGFINNERLIAGNNNADGTLFSRVTFNAQAGAEYQIQVGNFRYSLSSQRATNLGPFLLNGNYLPSAAVTTPAPGSLFAAPASFTMAAQVASFTGSVERVEFYAISAAATNLLASVTNAPYQINVTNLDEGSYNLYARVFDNRGDSTYSQPVPVQVIQPGARITSPANGQYFGTISNLLITAEATASEAITQLRFYSGNTLLGQTPGASGSYDWTTFWPGGHDLRVVAETQSGQMLTSAVTRVTIKAFAYLVQAGSVWKYLDTGVDQGMEWVEPGFDDSAWAEGAAELGDGDAAEGRPETTVINIGPTGARYPTIYFRRHFVATNVANITNLICLLKRDDGAVVWLNGQRLYLDNISGNPVLYNTLAPQAAPDDGANFNLSNQSPLALVEGTNVLAVEIHQNSLTSSDLSFDFEMVAEYNVGLTTVVLSSPLPNAYYMEPAVVPLTATASHSLGQPLAFGFYQNGVSLGAGTVAGNQYSLVLSNLPVGNYTFTAMATDSLGFTATSVVANVSVYPRSSHWVAFNDQAPGPGTAPFTTTYDAFGQSPNSGNLTNSVTGEPLAAVMAALGNNGIQTAGTMTAAPAGTPAYNIFNGYVDLAGAPYPGILILASGGGQVNNRFSGLSPSAQYGFRGTSIRGEAAYTNRWTLVRLQGARAFRNAHTAGVLTRAHVPSLAENEAIYNSGFNLAGDVVGWDDIVPAEDGSFTVVCAQFAGVLPNGLPADGPYGYSLNAFRLEEFGPVVTVAMTSPADNSIYQGPTNLTLSAAVSAPFGISSVGFYADGVLIGNDATAPYSLVWTNAAWATNRLTSVAYDNIGGRATSAVVTVTVNPPPPNLEDPYVVLANVSPAPGSRVTNLTQIAVRFNEPVTGVNASDFLVNGVAATSVSGSGSNYTFTIAQPAVGTAQISWAANHGIQDLGYPARAFDATAPGAVWSYEIADGVPPGVVSRTPAANSTLTNLTEVTVIFSEAVTNVDYGDFLVNGVPAFAVNGSGNTYTFNFGHPAYGTVNITWATGHGITDLAGNPFNGTAASNRWNYTLVGQTVTLMTADAVWRWLPGTNEASVPTNAWRLASFNDGLWSQGSAPFYYDTQAPLYVGNMLLNNMQGNYSTIYLRHALVVPNPSLLTNLTLHHRVDDGLVVWINGVEWTSTNTPSLEPGYDGLAPYGVGTVTDYTPAVLGNLAALVPGTNMIAIHALNSSLAGSSDFLMDVYITAQQLNPAVLAPRVAQVMPAPGYVYQLTNITVTFTRPVQNVDATDLLVNGTPALGISGGPQVFNFTVPQPAYGAVSLTWAANHGIVDNTDAAFDANLAENRWTYHLLNINAPFLAERTPTPNTLVVALTNAAVTFSKAVTGVNASDLLINGVPATDMYGAGSSGSNYVFTFPAPAYGPVTFTWASNPSIVDAANAQNVFDVTDPATRWQVTFVFQEPPVIAVVDPAPGSNFTNLTSVIVTFSEEVIGVDASDLLLNGQPMSSVMGAGNVYEFTFAQPPIGLAQFTWAAGHGIVDLGVPPLGFDGGGAGAGWSFNIVDGEPPVLISRTPGPGVENPNTTAIVVQFNEPVLGVNASDLLVNLQPATSLTVLGSNTYSFNLPALPYGAISVGWAANHGITDQFNNPFSRPAHAWSFINFNPNGPVVVERIPPPNAVTNELTNIWVRFDRPVTGVDAEDFLINYEPATAVSFVNGGYLFTFPQPPFGPVSVSWALFDGIVDAAQPANEFETFRPSANWQFLLEYQTPPFIAEVLPARGATVGSLSQLTITFSEAVENVNASDLLINGAPATGLTGSGSNYVFAFPTQPLGTMTVAWITNHGIQDLGIPRRAFDETAPDASWTYTVAETTPPVVASQNPPAGALVSNLFFVQVSFSEAVVNVDAGDLLVNGAPAFSLSGSNSTWTFYISPPAFGAVNISWAPNHGITDLAGNAFDASGAGATWSYSLQFPRVSLVASNSVWSYALGTGEVSSPIDAWRYPAYNASLWSTGATFFYYGDSLTGTAIPSMSANGYSSIFIRKNFVIEDPALVTNLMLRVAVDDGFVAWINGVEVARFNRGTPGTAVFYNSFATANANEPNNNGPAFLDYPLISPLPATYLVAGTNVIAIQGFNVNTTSSDFALNAELVGDIGGTPADMPPRIIAAAPPAGDIYSLSNLVVTFSKPVTGVDATDLLVNNVPATGVSGSNNLYTFAFPQPAYGSVLAMFASGSGIRDLSTPPLFFDANASSARFIYNLLNPHAPMVVAKSPDGSTPVGSLTSVTVTFSKAVTGVDAADLLVNGNSATGVTGSGSVYTFTFAQPAYGTVQFSWAFAPGITDTENPPNDFDGRRAGATWQVQFNDLTAPTIALVFPDASSTVTNLTQVIVNFSEPVTGVNAQDLLINGVPATTVMGTSFQHIFTFPAVNASLIRFTWAPAHGIADLATPPNIFDGNAPGSQWQYYTVDTTAPVITRMSPLPGTVAISLRELEVTFSEPIQGMEAHWLLVNGLPANSVLGSGAGPYRFNFAAPATGQVQVAWAAGHTIRDLASPPNPFVGQPWNYFYDPNANYTGQVVINEIMYSPSSLSTNDEWIEIRNLTAAPINLTGWRFNRGVDFTFPPMTLAANGYLVIAASTNHFQAKYPTVTNVIGNWVGQLSNNGEDIELETPWGARVALVDYASEGDWAIRRRGSITYYNGHRGWEWYTPAEGLGASLELVNANMPIQFGQNWLPSTTLQGTPGRANTVAAANTAPLVLEAQHAPAIPKSTEPVRITARILDETTTGISATVNWRDASTTTPGAFNSLAMNDAGINGDALANDQVFTAMIPARANLSIIEYYVEARDSGSRVRTWPGPAYELDGSSMGQVANALYQVDNDTTVYQQPQYRLIVTAAERQEMQNIWNVDSAGNSIDAQMNVTFIVWDRSGAEVRYNCGTRNRGNSSRCSTCNPGGTQNYHIRIPTDRPWRGIKTFNLNCKYTHSQYMGTVMFRQAGLPTEDVNLVRLKLNGVEQVNLIGSALNGPGNNQPFPYFVHLEGLNSDWAENHFPFNDGGNIYRCMRTANLLYLGTNYVSYTTGGYNYSKSSNQRLNDWSDLFNLTYVINNTPDVQWFQRLSEVINVDQWVRYYAVMSLTGFGETSIGSDGDPDDFSIYSGPNDKRFMVFPHDHDTDFGEGDGSRQQPTISIWRAADDGGALAFNRKFMRWPEVAPLYYAALKEYADTIFATNHIFATYDQLLGPLDIGTTVTRMKTWSAQRVASVLSQINLNLTVGNLNSFPLNSGFHVASTPNITLSGLGNVIDTRQVRVQNIPATWTAWNGQWSANVALTPGYNVIRVETLNSNGVVFASTNMSFFYDVPAQNVSGTISADTTWLAANGPYNVTGTLTIASGATLTIQAGTTVYLGSGVNLVVANGGRLLAEGTPTARIRFTRPWGTATTWGGITVNGSANSPETRIINAHFEFNNSTAIQVTDGTVFLDGLTFGNPGRQYVSLDRASFVVQNCTFPATTASFEPTHGSGGIKAGGRGIFRRNFFGRIQGYSDALDFTGGNRPSQPILQIINNVFMGSDDDLLDLDGTDAWIEGNIFLNTRRRGSTPDSGSAISGGSDSSRTSEITVVGNLFYEMDHMLNAKQGNFYTVLNNTMVRQNGTGSLDPETAVVILADDGTTQGAGMYLAGNIIHTAEQLTRNVTTALVTYTNNLIYGLTGTAWTGPGGGNLNVDPLLKYIPTLAEATSFTNWAQAQVMWDWFSLRPGSPAVGKGPGGRDLGGVVGLGAQVAGVPVGTTPSRTASLRVSFNITGNGVPAAGFPNGSGYTHYKWRLDGGVWSAETPIGTPIVLSGLPDGPHYVEVTGRNDAGYYQDDAVFGNDAVITRSATWVVDNSRLPLRINEVLASNRRAFEHFDSTPDAVELYNYGTNTIDLSGVRITDDPEIPDLYEFPAGASIGPGEYLVLLANDYDGTPGYHLEFALAQEGETLYLFDAVIRGGALLDSVAFGAQITDYSIGRMPDGQWTLNQPTLGQPNIIQPLGTPETLRINEWLAAGNIGPWNDFVEIFNPQTLPVELAGLYLTDNLEGWPTRHTIAPLSYIGPRNYAVFQASGDASQGPSHLNFRLSAEHGDLALVNRNLKVIDTVFYDFLQPDYSLGRSPNGAAGIYLFSQPTPGSGNPFMGGATNVVTTNITLVDFTSTWRYNADNFDLGTTWRAPSYVDSAWATGAGLFAKSISAAYPVPTGTTLTELGQPTVYYRTRFVYNGETNGFNLALSHYVDDGMVVYLNGVEINRYNITAGIDVTFTTSALNVSGNAPLIGPVILPITGLVLGTNVLTVEGHQSSGSTDMAFALNLTLTRSVTNIVGGSVVINEIFANGENYTNVLGTASDWVELYNPGDQPVSLAGVALTDNPANPLRWTFPAGTTVPARGYLVVGCDGSVPASTNLTGVLNSGFGLKGNGGGVYLYDDTMTLLSSVSYGIQIPDYSIGRSPNGTGDLVLTTPTPAAANIVVALGNPAQLKINEWMPNDRNGADDWFELYNPGTLPVSLADLYVTDDLLNPIKSPFAPLSYIGGGTNAFLKIIADNNPAAGANHARFALNATRESIGLGFSNAYIDTVSWNYAVSQPGVSEGRFPNGGTNLVFFTETASPEEANYLLVTNVVISEILSHTDLPFEDAIELHNVTDQPVDIGGWFLSDAKANLAKFQIPAGTIIPARGFRVFYEYQFNENPADNRLAFALSSAKGDEVYLSVATTNGVLSGYRTSARFGAAFNGMSFGRYLTSDGRADFTALSQRTFGVDEPNTVGDFRTGTGASNAYPRISDVVIRQIMYHPPEVDFMDDVLHEFIELYNRTAATIPLHDPVNPTNTWRLRDGVDFEFAAGFSLPPGGSVLVVSFDPVLEPALLNDFRQYYRLSTNLPIVGPYRGKLDNAGENVELYQPDAPVPAPNPDAGLVPYVEVDKVKYSDGAPWPLQGDGDGYSLQRVAVSLYGNDPVNWAGGPVSFLQTNAIALNTPPSLVAIPDQLVFLSQTLVLTNRATDGDQPPQILTFELGPNTPAGVVLQPASGVLTWTPTQTGTQVLTVIVRDSGTPSLSATQSFQVVVEDRRANLVQNGNNYSLTWPTQSGRSYRVQYKDNLNDAVWNTLPGGDVSGTGGNATIIEPVVPGRSQRYYRVLVLP